MASSIIVEEDPVLVLKSPASGCSLGRPSIPVHHASRQALDICSKIAMRCGRSRT